MLKEKLFQMKSLSDALPQSIDLQFHMCGITYPNRNYLINRPNSFVSCIEYIVSGTGHVQIGDKHFSPQAGDTYFLPQGADHLYGSDRKEPWEKIWINFSGDFALRIAETYGINETFYYPKLDTSDLLLKFQYYADRPGLSNTAEKCTSLLMELFFRLSQSLNVSEPKQLTPVQTMLAYIEQHETEPICLEQLAAACRKSPSQAERLFRAETGVPLYRYVLNRKIELACQLLLETGMSVRDIAAYLSFDDEFYFSGLFRRKTGLSPTAYRKQSGQPNAKKDDATQSLQKETSDV